MEQAVTTDYLQDQEDVEPESGKFTAYECGVEYHDKIEESGIDQKGLRLYLHWDLPVADGYRATTFGKKKKNGYTKDKHDKIQEDLKKLKVLKGGLASP